MDAKANTSGGDRTARIVRVTWFCAFVLPLILAVLLLSVKVAHATSPLPGLPPLAVAEGPESEVEEEEEEEEEAGELAEEECELAEEEVEAGELAEAEAAAACAEPEGSLSAKATGPGSPQPGRCPLRSARTHAVDRRGRLRVTVGYTSSHPTGATIEIRAGSARLAPAHRHLGKSGVLRIVRRLGGGRPRRVTVRVRAPSCPGFKARTARVR